MTKHIPIRSCAVCRERAPKRDLIRFTKSKSSAAAYVRDDKQVLPGRGIYLCGNESCLKQGSKKIGLTEAVVI